MMPVMLATIRHNGDGTVVEGTIAVDPDTAVRRVRPRSVEVSALDFYDRFTDAERLAVQTASQTNAQIALGLTHGLLRGSVTLTGATVRAWMDALVSAGAVTADRGTEILTP